MKERFSNVLAWLGFLYLVLVNLFALMDAREFTDVLIGTRSVAIEQVIITVLVYVGCAAVNYIMVGSFRFFPFIPKDFKWTDFFGED